MDSKNAKLITQNTKIEFDIEKRTYAFSMELLTLLPKIQKSLGNDVLVRQAIRSGTSIGANIHESRGGHTKKDFVNFHSIALKSANETIYWLNLLKDTNIQFRKELQSLIDEVEQLAKIIAKIKINASR